MRIGSPAEETSHSFEARTGALCREQGFLGDGVRRGQDGEESDGAVHEGYKIGVVAVERNQSQRHVEGELDAVVVAPGAIDAKPGAGSGVKIGAASVDE